MKTTIYSQHQEHTEWMNKLSFYKDELKIMQKRLEEVISKNTGMEARMKVEHFQNQILLEEQAISKLVHHITKEEKEIQNNITNNPTASDHRKTEDHTEERNMMEFFEKNFNNMRKELNSFLSVWM